MWLSGRSFISCTYLQGTVEFIAPELMSCKSASTASDMWSDLLSFTIIYHYYHDIYICPGMQFSLWTNYYIIWYLKPSQSKKKVCLCTYRLFGRFFLCFPFLNHSFHIFQCWTNFFYIFQFWTIQIRHFCPGLQAWLPTCFFLAEFHHSTLVYMYCMLPWVSFQTKFS